MRIHTLERQVHLQRPLEEIFAFFSNAHNLNLLTPEWLHFEVLSPPDLVLQAGTHIDYRLRWHGIPIRWTTEIVEWEPPHRFVDRQLLGPYKQWLHEHRFTTEAEGTLMCDRVDYAVPGWILEPVIHHFLVGPDVRRVFDYRSATIERLFPHEQPRVHPNGLAGSTKR